jgi:membrane-associated protease RseP (regulator of RpoE activity)
MVGPAGTFGAFIKILSPMPTRKAIFDIGVAGPIAGFIALLPVAAAAYATMTFGSTHDIQSGNISPHLVF